MNKPRPNTTREALIAEVLGELDGLLARVEALPDKVAGAETNLTATVTALADAGDKYRMAVTAFSEQAKAELTEYLERMAGAITAKTIEEQRAAMQDAARMAFRSEASDKAASLAATLGAAAKEFRRTAWTRLLETAVTALLSSAFTGAIVYALLRAD